MNITIQEQKAIENLRRLRENGTLKFDIAGAFEKDLRDIEEFANCNIPSFSKEFFLRQVEMYSGHRSSLKNSLTRTINSIWN